MEGVVTRSQSAKLVDDTSKLKETSKNVEDSSKLKETSKNGSKKKKSTITCSTTSASTSSSSRARAAARKAKLQIELKALKERELLEREEMLLRQRREEELKERQRLHEEELREKRIREEEKQRLDNEFQLQAQMQELEIMQRKRLLQLQVDLDCAAAEHAAFEEIAEREHSVDCEQMKEDDQQATNPEPSTANVVFSTEPGPTTANVKLSKDPGPKAVRSLSKIESSFTADAKVTTSMPTFSHLQADEPVRAKPQHRTTFNAPTSSFRDEITTSFVPAYKSTNLSKYPVPEVPHVTAPYLSQQHLLQGMASLKLPSAELPVFTGEPIRYYHFITAFESLIESKEIDARQCLYYLAQYTKGMARDLVNSCLYITNSNEALERAKTLLKDNYGQPYQITSAFISKLTDGPILTANNAAELQTFAVDLETCLTTLTGIDCDHEMNNQHVLRQIINRLPVAIQHKWRSVADNIMHEVKRPISIKDIVHFVRKQAREATNPIFGVPTKRKQTNQKSFFASSNVKSPKPHENDTKVCPLCSAHHYLNQCKRFRSLSYKDRLKFVTDEKLCFACLNTGHRASSCSRTDCCRRENCTKKHTTLLHPPSPPSASEENSASEVQASNGFVGARTNNAMGVMLPVLPVKVRAADREFVKTYAFLDPGSTASFCTDQLLNELNVTGREVRLKTTTIAGCNVATNSMLIQNLTVSDFNENEHVVLPQCFSIKSLPISESEISSKVDLSDWNYLDQIPVHNLDAQVGLLIGSDYPQILQPHEVIRSQNSGPFAYRTLLGWVVTGPNFSRDNRSSSSFFIRSEASPVCEMCSDLCSVQSDEYSVENQRFLTQVNESVVLKDNNHYKIALPFKYPSLKVPSNKELALQRLMTLRRKFLRKPVVYDHYVQCINKMLASGYAEKAPAAENNDVKFWYIPHHGVYHPMKPGKIRVVFDCSARYHGFSLNDNLLQGPDLTNSLLGVICRFRLEEVAIMGDIRSMFHQIEIPERDRDLLRFLWWEEGNLNNEPQDYRMKVYIFGATCSPSVANFALRKTAEDNRSDFTSEACEAVLNNFYVDDCLVSTPDEDSAIRLVTQITKLLQRGGFHITKWVSNSDLVYKSVPEEDRAPIGPESLPLATALTQGTRALGLLWSTETDEFHFMFNYSSESRATRRQMLSIVNSVYDPLGFLVPVMLTVKILQQEMCRKGLSWDEEIDNQSQDRFDTWIKNLSQLSSFRVDRCLKPSNFGKVLQIEFHHFSDASEDAYGCVSYVRFVNENLECHCCLLFAKCRLTPIQRSTIPRLELNAATLSIKNDQFLRKELKYDEITSYFWSDSITVLRYIHNESRAFKTFVANRVAFIRNNSDLSQWRFVPGAHNPADKATRGMTFTDFLACHCWIPGPEFLRNHPDDWPAQPDFVCAIPEIDPELKPPHKVCHTCVSIGATVDELLFRYSDWIKLKITAAWLLRYRNNLHKRRCSEMKVHAIQPLSVDELRESEIQMIKYEQRKFYADEIEALTTGKTVKRNSHLVSLDPFIDESGILRVGGRLRFSPINFNQKHQILIPRESNIASLVIKDFHSISGHVGRAHVLALLRERFWIPKANSLVRSVLNSCFSCRKNHGALGRQKMADLPSDRVTPGLPPFSFVGTDYFGPFMVKRGRSSVKRYGVLFTCLNLRAIHIEIAHSLDTSSFIQALRRFIARRGPVMEIRSDNGTNFVGAKKELEGLINQWNQNTIYAFLLQKQIKWVFNVPTASHHGGVWERSIRSVRKILSSVVQEQTLDDESLLTYMCEVENVVNSRPITCVSDDVKDPQPLTPNMLLHMKSDPSLPPGQFEQTDMYSRKHWRRVQYLADLFWKRWIKEYLPLLQKRQKWAVPNRNFTAGDIVLIADHNLPRNAWNLGVIVETRTDKHGLVRSAKIKTSTSLLDRPITKLCLLSAAEKFEI